MAEPTVVDGQSLLVNWPIQDPEGTSDKDERGALVVVGGARGTPGAVLLAGIAALRVGAGKLTIATVDAHADVLAVELPEAGVVALPTTETGAISSKAVDQVIETCDGVDAVLIGPGMADPDETRNLVREVIKGLDSDTVIVLDALGATCGALTDDLRSKAHQMVITPNAKEAGYLLDDIDGDETDIARRLASRYGAIVLLGSHVAAPDGACRSVPRGNPGLGTSGSGDVLAGAVTGIAARVGDPLTAALWGRSLHGAAGDRLEARVGAIGYLARELLDELPGCLRDLSR
jgi:hydroxyethylthiazole kinase-like uncharacterized protein yjeF